jgi:predicted RNA-binding protein with PUA-like domain
MSAHVYYYHYTTCTKPCKWAVMRIVTIKLPVQSQVNERSCVLLPLHYLYKDRKMNGDVYFYHYTSCTKPGQWAVMCIVTITLPVQSQVNKRPCILLPLQYIYKARTMSGNVYCYHYTICTKPGQCAIICIVTITLPVKSQVNERSCVLLPLHYLYKARKMNGDVYFYHYTSCTKPGQWAVMCIFTITLPVQSQVNKRPCILLPLQYMYKARKMSDNVYFYHYTICTKPGQCAIMCIVTFTLPVQSQDNERSCVLLPLHYLYKARTMSGHVYCYHYTTCTKPGQWADMCIVTITLPVQTQENERSCVLLPLHYLYKAR